MTTLTKRFRPGTYNSGQPYAPARGRYAPRLQLENRLAPCHAVIDLPSEQPEAARFIDAIKREMKIRCYQRKTIKTYKNALRLLLGWFGGPPPSDHAGRCSGLSRDPGRWRGQFILDRHQPIGDPHRFRQDVRAGDHARSRIAPASQAAAGRTQWPGDHPPVAGGPIAPRQAACWASCMPRRCGFRRFANFATGTSILTVGGFESGRARVAPTGRSCCPNLWRGFCGNYAAADRATILSFPVNAEVVTFHPVRPAARCSGR